MIDVFPFLALGGVVSGVGTGREWEWGCPVTLYSYGEISKKQN